ncbi:S8 family serine peptidase [Candidatus Margulisiibacteriota bacterium]
MVQSVCSSCHGSAGAQRNAGAAAVPPKTQAQTLGQLESRVKAQFPGLVSIEYDASLSDVWYTNDDKKQALTKILEIVTKIQNKKHVEKLVVTKNHKQSAYNEEDISDPFEANVEKGTFYIRYNAPSFTITRLFSRDVRSEHRLLQNLSQEQLRLARSLSLTEHNSIISKVISGYISNTLNEHKLVSWRKTPYQEQVIRDGYINNAPVDGVSVFTTFSELKASGKLYYMDKDVISLGSGAVYIDLSTVSMDTRITLRDSDLKTIAEMVFSYDTDALKQMTVHEYDRYGYLRKIKYYDSDLNLYGSRTPNPEFSKETLAAAAAIPDISNYNDTRAIVLCSNLEPVDYNNPRISGNIQFNLADPVDGKDNDQDGYTDNYAGYDFMDNDPFPFPDNEDDHGSFTGEILTQGSNRIRLIPVRPRRGGLRDSGDFKKAVDYVVKRGVSIVSMSWGINEDYYFQGVNTGLKIDIAEIMAGYHSVMRANPEVLFFSSLDNNAVDAKQHKKVPASINESNHLAVMALDNDGFPAYFTGWKSSGPYLAVDGCDIVSAYEGRTAKKSGTSAAVQVVGNVAANMQLMDPALKTMPDTVLKILLSTAVAKTVYQVVVRSVKAKGKGSSQRGYYFKTLKEAETFAAKAKKEPAKDVNDPVEFTYKTLNPEAAYTEVMIGLIEKERDRIITAMKSNVLRAINSFKGLMNDITGLVR